MFGEDLGTCPCQMAKQRLAFVAADAKPLNKSIDLQTSFRQLLREGKLEDRTVTFELPATGQKMQPFDGMGGIAVHELISGWASAHSAPVLQSVLVCPSVCLSVSLFIRLCVPS